jgi:acetyl esterase/lipase
MSIQAFLTRWYLRSQFKPQPGTHVSVDEARQGMARMSRWQVPLPKGVHLKSVPADAAALLCPAEWLSVQAPQRTVLYFHGGGYFSCGLDTHRPVVAAISRRAQARVLSVDYRLAPEHPCPAAVEDALAWYRDVLSDTPAAQIVLAGDSAGGGLVVACLQAALQQGLPMPAGAVLFSPWVDLASTGESVQAQARTDVMFNPENLVDAAQLYLAGRSATDPVASPLYGDMEGLPALLIFASQSEILLSDATRLHDKAQAAGVTSQLVLQPNMPHVWPIMVMLPEAKASLRQVAAFMRDRVPGL